VGNWSDYDRSLVKRGNLTIWLSLDAIARWSAKPSRRRGGPRKYSDLAIQAVLTDANVDDASVGLLVVARLHIALATTQFAKTSNDPLSRMTFTASGLRGLDRRHNDLRALAKPQPARGAGA
jgi:hypothetical protein